MSAEVCRNHNKQGLSCLPCMHLQPSFIPGALFWPNTFLHQANLHLPAPPSRLPQIVQGIESLIRGALMLQSYLLQWELLSCLLELYLPDWHYWRKLKPGTNLVQPIYTHTHSLPHYKDFACTHSLFFPGYVFSLGCQSNIHNNWLLDFPQQHLSLPACLFPFLLYNILGKKKRITIWVLSIPHSSLAFILPPHPTAIVIQAIKPASIISTVIEGCGCEDLTRRW